MVNASPRAAGLPGAPPFSRSGRPRPDPRGSACIGALPTSPDPATPELQPAMAGLHPAAQILLEPRRHGEMADDRFLLQLCFGFATTIEIFCWNRWYFLLQSEMRDSWGGWRVLQPLTGKLQPKIKNASTVYTESCKRSVLSRKAAPVYIKRYNL